MSYFNENSSYVCACFFDLKKAFDLVNFWKLFIMLLSVNVSKDVVNVLACMYSHQRLSVRWNSVLSEKCLCSNGVRQGSPCHCLKFLY